MSSILTNNGAMVALQTMKNINQNLSKVQQEISTGKSIATARDNAAIWSISKVMESDVKSFKGISDSLALGSSALTVAADAANSIAGLLTDMKEKIVTAQGENVPREKLQTDLDALKAQIKNITSAAQFSGLNLISGTDDVKFLASLDRSVTGVSVSDISIGRQDMGTSAGKMGTGDDLTANLTARIVHGSATAPTEVKNNANTAMITIGGGLSASQTMKISIGDKTINLVPSAAMTASAVANYFKDAITALGLEGITAEIGTTPSDIIIKSTLAHEALDLKTTVTGASPPTANIVQINGVAPATVGTTGTIPKRGESIDFSTAAQVKEGDGYKIKLGAHEFSYIAARGDTMEDVARGLKVAIDAEALDGVTTEVKKDTASGQWSLSIDNDTLSPLTIGLSGAEGGKASGGLFGLDQIKVTSTEDARAALQNIETMINKAIDAAAEFGSAQGRIDIQSKFVTSLTDAMTSGIGALVDANMEEASARLQALQVQQQLGIQALSIANQAPQNLLSLFR